MIATLPYPPSANRYFRVFRGRAVTSAEARAYKLKVGLLLRGLGVRALTGPVTVSAVVTRPAKRGDLDNLLKVLLDALNGIAYGDDSQIVELHAARHEGTKATAGVVVSVQPAKEEV